MEALRAAIRSRKLSYTMVFDRKNQFTNDVLRDLAKFCRAHETTFLPDPRAHAVLEGRREVWLRIAQHLQLNEDEIYDLHIVREERK